MTGLAPHESSNKYDSSCLQKPSHDPLLNKGSGDTNLANPNENGVEISIYAVPLFRNPKGDVQYVYIPVRHAEQMPNHDEGCPSSSFSPCDRDAVNDANRTTTISQQLRSRTLVSSLKQQMANATSTAQSTWDSWGRMDKGTWLRWFHDIGQTVTEDVSPEARLARGISSRATKVIVYHPDCVTQEEAHQHITQIVSARSKSELWRMIGSIALFPVGLVLDNTVLVAIPAPVGTGYSSYKAYMHYKGARGSWRMQHLIKGYEESQLMKNKAGSLEEQQQQQQQQQQRGLVMEEGACRVEDMPVMNQTSSSPIMMSTTTLPLCKQALHSAHADDPVLCASVSSALSVLGCSSGSSNATCSALADTSVGKSNKYAAVGGGSDTPCINAGEGGETEVVKHDNDTSHHNCRGRSERGEISGLRGSLCEVTISGDPLGSPEQSSSSNLSDMRDHMQSLKGRGVTQNRAAAREKSHNRGATFSSMVAGVSSNVPQSSHQGLGLTKDEKHGKQAETGLEYIIMSELTQFVDILVDTPGGVLPEEAARRLCMMLPMEHRGEVDRHISELRRRHFRQQQASFSTRCSSKNLRSAEQAQELSKLSKWPVMLGVDAAVEDRMCEGGGASKEEYYAFAGNTAVTIEATKEHQQDHEVHEDSNVSYVISSSLNYMSASHPLA
ncbi:hypothetical protein CEUSTIGMA_g9007.t1 [Chlamydomonas eustigma]|uniref:Uncharacterized protein n=1 Tax=Chlamydomonas eustigma TaxID=1157962 RepID=A0A250XF84_9CHLO|nr:hypothetical protein CEUSTIGMA_g9007.t1 [Chlamydomonas eustigma]|eukprot:GAX81579.1 hypothetical protein CEUSTIGMA_g9007.t1 [Chlamydomonas eustigma]